MVGLSGKRVLGKDTFASLLSKHAAARGLVLRTYAFAAESKRMFVEKRLGEGVAIDGERLLSDRAYKEQLRPELTRFTVASIAAEPLVFCRSVADRIARAPDLELPLITDVRLTLEVEQLRSRFELHLARLLRSDARRADSGWRFTPDVDGHHTETELDDSACPRTSEMSNVVFNDTFEAADKDPARCARRADEFVSWCGAGQGATARFIRGTTVEREEKVPASTTHCQLTLPDCPRSPAMAGPFNDSFEHADTDEGRCLRRADDWRNHCGTGAAVTARFFRGATKSAERTATSATRCQVTVDARPTHTDYVAVFNDPFDGSDTSADRCAKRAPEFVTWCGGGKATARFYRGANLEREQRAP